MKRYNFLFACLVLFLSLFSVAAPAGEMHKAAGMDDVSRMRYLISQGEKIDEKDDAGKTPLMIARQQDSLRAVEFLSSLIIRSYPSGSTYVGQHRGRFEEGWGVYFGHRGSSYVGYFKSGRFHGMGIWRYADGTKYIGEFRDGLFYKKDRYGEIGLDVAVQKKSLDTVKLLIAQGADVNAVNSEGQTPLHYAAFEGDRDVVLLLLEHGAELEHKDSMGQTPLHYASYTGHRQIVELLLERGADIHCRNNLLTTPLHYAVYHDSYDTAQLLLENGASVYKRDKYGLTPIKHAIRLKRNRVLKLLNSYRLR